MLLVPPVLLKVGSTSWRFVQYYTGSPEYRAKGPPSVSLRLLGPIVVVLTFIVFVSGIVLLLGPSGLRSQMLLVHKASFLLWLAVMTIHVLGHLLDTSRLAPRDWFGRTRREVRGAGLRQWSLAMSVALGLMLAILVMPRVGPWLVSGHLGHR
jgi:cytochrome c biogenesis protein CcdA